MSSANGSGKESLLEQRLARTRDRDEGDRPRSRFAAMPSLPPSRRLGRSAEEAQLRARYELARVLGDTREERDAARNLAERLASRDVEIDLAVEIARKSLAKQDDPPLRHALAGWLEGLGEPGLAAAELRKLVASREGPSAAALLVRIGVLHARAGDPLGAEEALSEAARTDESDSLPLELLGAIGGWSAAPDEPDGSGALPGTMTPRSAAEAYVRAASRRRAAGDEEAELEDLLRAFEVDPSSTLAAASLVAAHKARGRPSSADEVLRAHADTLLARGKSVDAAEVHAQRRASAIEEGDFARALGAALDEGLDAVLEGPGADAMDEVLARVAAYEPLAARLRIRAERSVGRPASQRWADVGRLLSGPLASPERALESYGRAVAADATNADALHALRALAQQSGDPGWLLEALIRAALGDAAYGASAEAEPRLAAARALAELAEEQRDGALAAWSYAEIVRGDATDERSRAAADRHADALKRHEEEVSLARRTLETSAAEGRIGALHELARLLKSDPTSSRELASALVELARGRPDDDAVFADALRVAERVSDFAAVAELCRARLARPAPPPRVRIALVAALRRAGDPNAAAEAASQLFDAITPWAYSIAWIHAAVAGDRATRARALSALAPTCGPKVLPVLASVAAEELAKAGDLEAARAAATQASRADAENARALRAVALLLAPAEPRPAEHEPGTADAGRVATTALERAIGACGPMSVLCMRLADAYEHLGEAASAIAWARRVVALRPGDAQAVQSLVDRAARAEDVDALADALAWLVPQPRPARATVEAIVPALRVLATRDANRAALVCRRALDVLGPRHAALRGAIASIAVAANDAPLAVRLSERWVAAGAPAAERGALLLHLGARYADLGDVDRELVAYVRAAREGAELGPARDRIDALAAEELSADAELAWLEARAELFLDEGRADLAARTFRELGAALWDSADDRPRAVQAWLRAAQHDSARGYTTLRGDLSAFADPGYATDCLAELVDRETDRVRGGIIATEAARAALEAKAYPRALALARTALERHPGHAAALETAERACAKLGRVQEMSPLYDQVARRALGRFGRRAAHHRAARFFEASGINMMALKHAAQAFIAVPSEGSTLGLLARTADRANRRSVAVRTLEHVADLARGQGARAAWLLRAASMTARDLDGTRQRVDLLLKASVLVVTPATLAMLAASARDLLSLAPDDSEALAMRLERSSDALAKDLEGPDGARIGIVFAEMALDLFGDAGWAWRALERAAAADADIEEYQRLLPRAADLARTDGAAAALARIWENVEKPYSNVGHSLLRLVAAVAHGLGDIAKRAKALVLAAEKEPDDDEIVADADDAVAKSLDTALVERLSKKVGVFRRSEALRAIAAKAVDRGDGPASIRFLERAYVIAPGEVKDAISRELKSALVKAGRGEEAVLREIAAEGISREERAEHWAELAKIRGDRGDSSGATDALLQAATEDPSAARWSAVEAAAESSGREHIRVDALQRLVDLAPSSERLAVMKRLARAEAARGSLTAAETAWRNVWDSDPSDGEADVALEALLVARASYDELAEHLARRAARLAEDKEAHETLRAVRLRRAAILEQRLGRLEMAAQELEQLLRESPGHASALRWLADLYERMGQPERAVPALEELSANDPIARESSGVRRVRALLEAGEIARANEIVRGLYDATPTSIPVLEARVAVARAMQDARELGDALAELGRQSVEDPRTRSELLVEAAQAAARAGDTDASLERAREAAGLAPDVASTQLFARGLEYRLRGAGSLEEATETVRALERLQASTGLEAEDVALRAFLLAEAQDVVVPGSAERTLRDCLTQVGPQPLIALALAERASAAGRAGEALHFYEEAVYGNLLGLRRPGAVALAAAEAAELAGNSESLVRFLNEAAKDPESRTGALRRLGEGSIAARDLGRAKTLFRGLAETLYGAERADVLGVLARALFESPSPADRLEADRTMREAIDSAAPDVAERMRQELATYRARAPVPSATPSAMGRPPVTGALPRIPEPAPVLIATVETPRDRPAASLRLPLVSSPVPAAGSPPVVPAPLASAERAPRPPRRVATPAPPLVVSPSRSWRPRPPDDNDARIEEARTKLIAGARQEAEDLLFDALRGGSMVAADALDAILVDDPGRTTLLTKVRRMAAELSPGDNGRLVALRDAAHADQNANYVRAIEHVIRAFDTRQGPLAPPPLSAQILQPGLLGLLTRHSREPAGEAFACVWEGAQNLFAKPPTAYGMTGLERVVPGPTSALSRLYEVALRLLDTPRFGLFHRRGPGVLSSTVALLTSPAAILSGFAGDDGPELRWVLGQALAGVLPQNAMPLAMVETEGRAVWQVLASAFGPPGRVKVARENAALAEMLWQTLAPRAQRRLKDLLATDVDTPFELVVERARQSGRRVGMFLTGDFAHAARTIVGEFRRVEDEDLRKPGGLRLLCAELPALADLFRLAIRPEYADARWYVPAPSAQRYSSGNVRLNQV